jgi:predicted kinase
MELAILVGIQGSGKSTFYRQRLAATHEHVSKDLMRSARDKNRRQRELIEAALRQGRSVAVDNTNPAPADRQPLVGLGRTFGARVVGYFFDAPIAECLERNAGREGRARVPPVAIYVTARKMVAPSLDEGFDALYRVRLVEGGFEVVPLERAGSQAGPNR